MPTTLRWITSVSSSCMHAADAVAHGKTLSDPRIAAAIKIPAEELQQEILNSPLPSEPFWRQLLTWAHHFDNNRQLATTAIRKVIAWNDRCESLAARLAERIGAVEAALQTAVPQMESELSNRSRPIREQWEARGPGLLRSVGKLTDERLLVESAEVVLVLPVLGGGGAAHLANNSIRFEAVLTNNVPQLPEVARMAWLLAQLQCDLPAFSEGIPADDLAVLAPLAFLAPILQAAQDVELISFNTETVALAISAWHVACPTESANQVADAIMVWWQTFLETRPNWKTGLSALQRMMLAGRY